MLSLHFVLFVVFFSFLFLVQAGGGAGGATSEYVVVGHCCESGDLLTPVSDSPSEIDTRVLDTAEIGELPPPPG